ncbi:outer membrane protein assembly factor BamB family protein [Enhygromyxa salina]|uniref:Outer membrane protein assembly factor BamB n=1 Tax=Enhygromyxa salina TaxID=215803 RepID=A0A2S9YMQ0_9BACT|nr:PQQ-binding-like beta-propeller repeat protein [Enhygromyxa salina]PRQ06364.1 Outer membrane protein assembly factor BamB precursor [Enhygromyxa salina]
MSGKLGTGECGSRPGQRARSVLLSTLGMLGPLGFLGMACGPAERTILIHEPEGDGARSIWSVDFVSEFTVPENYRYRTEEYGSAVADPSRGLVYVGSRDGMLVAFDDRVGEFVWELDIGGGLSSVPVLAVVDPEQGVGHEAAAGERANWLLTGTDDGAMVAVDLDTQQVRWRYRTNGLVRTPAVIGDGVVHFANSRDQILTVDLRGGEWVWEYDGEFQKDFTVYGRAGLAYQAPLDPTSSAGGVLFTGFADGKVMALDAVSGAPKWSESLAPLEGEGLFVDVDTTPVLDPERGQVLVANQASGVFALAQADGARVWNTKIRAVGSLAPAPGGVVLAASSLEGLYALEPDGRVRWYQQLDPGSLATPLVVGTTVFIAHSDVGLLAYATVSGELLGHLFNGSGSSGQPSFDPVLGRVYASSDRGQLYALRLSQ